MLLCLTLLDLYSRLIFNSFKKNIYAHISLILILIHDSFRYTICHFAIKPSKHRNIPCSIDLKVAEIFENWKCWEIAILEKLELEYWDYTNLIKVTSIQQYF